MLLLLTYSCWSQGRAGRLCNIACLDFVVPIVVKEIHAKTEGWTRIHWWTANRATSGVCLYCIIVVTVVDISITDIC